MSLRIRLLLALILLPVAVAAALTISAIHLVRQDKLLYVTELSTQSVDLVSRQLTTKLRSLKSLAASQKKAQPPLLSLTPGPAGRAAEATVRNISRGERGRLRVRFAAPGAKEPRALTIEIAPRDLLDLEGQTGPAKLWVVDREGVVLTARDAALVRARKRLAPLLRTIEVFGEGRARLGSREVELGGRAMVAAYARVGPGIAVVQAIDREIVLAAAAPLIKTAVMVSAATVGLALVLALLFGGAVIRPLRKMVQQAEAIGRGEFGVRVSAGTGGMVAKLAAALNTASASLEQRDEHLRQVQGQLLQAERLNASGRIITAIVDELSEPLESCVALASDTHRALSESSHLAAAQRQIVQHADRACSILQNLRRIAHHGDSEPRAVEVDLPIADALVSARPLLEKRGLEVDLTSFSQQVEAFVRADQLANALLDVFFFVAERARPASKITVGIRDHAAEGHGVTIAIHFSGEPVTEDERARLVDPRVSGARDERELVLAVAVMILGEERGRLSIDPTEDGNVVRLELPTASA